MSDLENPLVRNHYDRLVNFSKEVGLSPDQLQQLITLVSNLINARAALQRQKRRDANTPLSLWSGGGL